MSIIEKLYTKYKKSGLIGVIKAILKRITGYNYYKKRDEYILNKILNLITQIDLKFIRRVIGDQR